MRKLALVILAVLVLASCTEVTQIIEPPAPNARVYDSAWQIVAEARIETSRALTSSDALQSEVNAYNAAHLDDLRRLVLGETAIPLESAPEARAYIVAPDDYERLASYSVPRADLAASRETWRAQALALGGVLYVDRDPPDYIPPRIVTDYERYALYMVDALGHVVIENHCETWEVNGWASIEDYYSTKHRIYAEDCALGTWGDNRPWHLVSGELYKEP